jgi:hypothetical protein
MVLPYENPPELMPVSMAMWLSRLRVENEKAARKAEKKELVSVLHFSGLKGRK